MVRALLLRANGTCKEVTLRTHADYRRVLGGKTEMMATRSRTQCYVRKDPQKYQLPVSDFGELLELMGFEIESIDGAQQLMGDALLCGSQDGDDVDLPRAVRDLVSTYVDCEDRALFLLEMANKATMPSVEEEESEESVVDALS